MQLIRGLRHLDLFSQGCVLTIGNFDGLHLGHQRVIEKLARQAQALKLPSVAIVFEPQPLEYFLGDHAPSRLTRLREKAIQFAKSPLDALLVLPFNRTLADIDAEQFISEILVNRLRVRHMVIGDDFHFGKARRGNFAMLQSKGQELGFSVENSQSFELAGLRISSTLIRDALGEGQLEQAKLMLGRDYSVCGRVAHGDKRGRQLGFPTANVEMHRQQIPLHGVFAVTLTGLDDKIHHGVANLGTRPTINGAPRAVLETHLFDFNDNIYGRYVEVHFKAKLRNETRFPNLNALQTQIQLDVAAAKTFFAQTL